DPPYDVEFTQYAKGGFEWDDQERTAAWLAKHRGPVVLVNQATERVEQLYRKLGYRVDFLDAPRRISSTGDRTPAREIIGPRTLYRTARLKPSRSVQLPAPSSQLPATEPSNRP